MHIFDIMEIKHISKNINILGVVPQREAFPVYPGPVMK
jgi:hypothetical protein